MLDQSGTILCIGMPVSLRLRCCLNLLGSIAVACEREPLEVSTKQEKCRMVPTGSSSGHPALASCYGRDERIRTSGLTHPKGARYPCATSRFAFSLQTWPTASLYYKRRGADSLGDRIANLGLNTPGMRRLKGQAQSKRITRTIVETRWETETSLGVQEK